MRQNPLHSAKWIKFPVGVLLLIAVLLLSSCVEAQLIVPTTEIDPTLQAAAGMEVNRLVAARLGAASTPTPIQVPPTNTAAPTVLPRSTATFTPSPTLTPSNTPTPRPTETPTLTPTPTATSTPSHALMIETLRRQEYPGSQLVIESFLDPGENYNRYIVSYLSEGNRIFALLTVPSGVKPSSGWPVIIFNHGYIPPEEYHTTENYESYIDGMARNGYIVFRSDYRGHGTSEGKAVGGYGSPAYTIDILNGISALKTFSNADSERIGMWGHSMGGHITLRAMVVSQEIDAGVIWGGVVVSYQDLFERWRREAGSAPTATPDAVKRQGSWRAELENTYGTFENNPEFWASISPNTYVRDISGPLQLHHGTSDDSVPVEFSTSLYSQILTAGRDAELYLYVGDDHNIGSNFSTALQRTIDFFDKYVKNGEQGGQPG